MSLLMKATHNTKPKVKVDVTKQNSFTDEDLFWYRKCVFEPNFPMLYGDELTPQLIFVRHDMVDICDIERNKYGGTQNYRAGGTNPKKPGIERNISRNGFKLGYPAIALFRDKDGKLYIITGHTRIEILEDVWGFTNVIVSIYEANDNYTKKQVASAISLNGNIFNTIHDEAGQLELSDISREVNLAIENEWIGHDWDEILLRVMQSRGSGLFTDLKLSELAQEIFNTYNPNETVLNWKNDSKTVLRMNDYGFKKISTRSAHYEDDNGNKFHHTLIDMCPEFYISKDAADSMGGLYPGLRCKVDYFDENNKFDGGHITTLYHKDGQRYRAFLQGGYAPSGTAPPPGVEIAAGGRGRAGRRRYGRRRERRPDWCRGPAAGRPRRRQEEVRGRGPHRRRAPGRFRPGRGPGWPFRPGHRCRRSGTRSGPRWRRGRGKVRRSRPPPRLGERRDGRPC